MEPWNGAVEWFTWFEWCDWSGIGELEAAIEFHNDRNIIFG